MSGRQPLDDGAKDTVVEKLLAIFPAMNREVARSVLISCEYDLAQTVEALKELGIHKAKEGTLSPGTSQQPKGSQRTSSSKIDIPHSPPRGSSPRSAPRSSHGPSESAHAHARARSPSTYSFGTSPASNSYFTDCEDPGIMNFSRSPASLGPSSGRPAASSPNPYLAPNNPYLVPPGFPSGGFGGAASPSSRPPFYAYSYSSSPGSVYPIQASSSPSTAYGNRSASFSAYNPAGPSASQNPYTFSSSPRIPHPQQYPPASVMAPSSSPNPFYNYSYASSPGSIYPISAQPSTRNPFAPSSGGSSFGSASPGMSHYLSSPRTQYFSSRAGARFGSPAGAASPLSSHQDALRSSLDNRLRMKAIKIEDESESDSDSETESSDGETEIVGDNEVIFADEESLAAIRSPPLQEEEKKPTTIVLRTKQGSEAEEGKHHGDSKRQMPHLALRRFMKLVFKNRSDISPLNPLAALFLCLSQGTELQKYFLTDAYKANLKPDKNKHSSAPAALGISGEWDAQEIYHGSSQLSLAQHFALCVKAIQGRTHHDLRELDKQFAAFQKLVSSHTPHLTVTGSVEEEAGRYSEIVDWLIEHLKEDFDIKSPAFEPSPEDEALGDEHVAAKYWDSYKKTNPSLFATLFTGLLKTAITCSGCNHRAVSVSVTNGLTLPTCLDKKRSIVVTFVPDSVSGAVKPTKHTVSVFKTSYGQDLKAGLIEHLGKSLQQDQIILTEIYNGRVAQIIDDSTPVGVLKDKDVVVAYEVPAAHQNSRRRLSYPLDKNAASTLVPNAELPYFITHRFCKHHKDNDLGTNVVGRPFLVSRNLTYAQLYNIVWERFKEELGYAKELKFAELVEQIRECEEKRIASEKEAKGRDDKKGKCASSQKHVGPFDIKIVDQYLTNCGSCDKGFRCDGCVMPFEEIRVQASPEQCIVVDWNVTEEEYENKLRKSLLFKLSAERLEQHTTPTPKITIHDCLHKFIGQSRIREWFCPHCKEFMPATKVTSITNLPSTLIVHFSRFELNRYWHRVSKVEVDFPTKGFDLTGYFESDNCHEHKERGSDKALYDLQAVLQLSSQQGYSACVRNPGDGMFYHYTPNATYLLPSEDSDLAGLKSILCSGDACILFYSRCHS